MTMRKPVLIYTIQLPNFWQLVFEVCLNSLRPLSVKRGKEGWLVKAHLPMQWQLFHYGHKMIDCTT